MTSAGDFSGFSPALTLVQDYSARDHEPPEDFKGGLIMNVALQANAMATSYI